MSIFINRIIIICVTVCFFSCKTNTKEKNEGDKVESNSSLSSKVFSKKKTDTEFVTYFYSRVLGVEDDEEYTMQELKIQWNDSLHVKFKIAMENTMCIMKEQELEASLITKNTYQVKNHPIIKQLKFDDNKDEVKLICKYGKYEGECDPMDDIIMRKTSFTGKSELKKEELEEEDKITYETIYELKKMKFSTDCKGEDYVFFLVGGQFKTKNIFFNSRLTRINETEYYIYFSPPLLDPIPSGLNDADSFSLIKPIGKITNNMEGELQFEWYGFYNRRTKEREFIQNPFTNKIEKGSIVLKWCDIGNVDGMGFD
ncbi:hypothetical protein I2486_08505 [Cellulophaga sp. E16_2]|uniref:hypothetical protein n=1 Tax=Cellulophaga sp. E16_2 TaxID=2789297 RepID=UPI001A93A09A|nr:hypothetical protein [Cellulophaga sp. E16_2]MBO0591450.1 hypothetical protein [Cellulophaga sp. E16_2]